VIPFRRDDIGLEGSIRAESAQEAEEREQIRRRTHAAAG
jgi:hypothetical protein